MRLPLFLLSTKSKVNVIKDTWEFYFQNKIQHNWNKILHIAPRFKYLQQVSQVNDVFFI